MQWLVQHGKGQANTALVFHAKRLLSLHEGDLPYAVRLIASLCSLLGTAGQTPHSMRRTPCAGLNVCHASHYEGGW